MNKKLEEFKQKLWESVKDNKAPWIKTWKTGEFSMAYNVSTNHEYKGANALYLTALSCDDPRWCGFNQAKKKGWSIKKGSKAVQILVAMPLKKKVDENGEEKEKTIMYYTAKPVFHGSQITGLPDREIPVLNKDELIDAAEKAVLSTGVKIVHTPSMNPQYHYDVDTVYIPYPKSFESIEYYYGALFHELAHAMENESRLGSFDKVRNRMRRELRADITAFLVCSDLRCGFSLGYKNSTVAYVDDWLKNAESPKNEVYKAVKQATKIADYMLFNYRNKT